MNDPCLLNLRQLFIQDLQSRLNINHATATELVAAGYVDDDDDEESIDLNVEWNAWVRCHFARLKQPASQLLTPETHAAIATMRALADEFRDHFEEHGEHHHAVIALYDRADSDFGYENVTHLISALDRLVEHNNQPVNLTSGMVYTAQVAGAVAAYRQAVITALDAVGKPWTE
ncbi:hypothetical protein AB7W88_03250 [Providencia vermicola]|uniref:Uncharacterized protein n=1 Tax=Providencia rettgeri TaxID=587 RepID=A0A264VQG0_PRORE|nr:hypothetical protein [Providencia rettgeri]EKW7426920.1 hypothetical protein [Proteus mirabilis]OZS73529.1 hypothetical protein CHI95_16625 [Providencia rettgeri]